MCWRMGFGSCYRTGLLDPGLLEGVDVITEEEIDIFIEKLKKLHGLDE